MQKKRFVAVLVFNIAICVYKSPSQVAYGPIGRNWSPFLKL